ncbi:MAG TPA: hypothetical protein VIX37_21060 [Candidatus Sulfotelmatobacter sp.]
MNRLLGWMVSAFVLILISSYMWTHRERVVAAVAVPAAPVVTQGTPTDQTYDEVRDAQHAVTLAGPLANYMAHQKPSDIETLNPIKPPQPAQPNPPAGPALHRTGAPPRVADSPVGTSRDLVHQMFGVAKVVELAFEVPANASNPQLRGTYESFVKRGGALSSESDADIEFLVLNAKQYEDFLNGRPGEAVFSAEDAHSLEVNTSLRPTLDEPAKYYLIFRNNSHTPGKKMVQADFHIDF